MWPASGPLGRQAPIASRAAAVYCGTVKGGCPAVQHMHMLGRSAMSKHPSTFPGLREQGTRIRRNLTLFLGAGRKNSLLICRKARYNL